ncbi:MAG: thiamine pyrophosphate-binding protein, partial [Solirubrobacteraceae bacterium]
MSDTVGAFMLKRLRSLGVERIYGYPGDGINGILGAFHEVGDDIELIQCRHEEIAAFAAAAHAKLTDEFGVCLATSGPGAIHLLNGLYDAKLDKRPVVAIIAQQHRSALGSGYQQEIDAHSLFKDVCSQYLNTVTTPEQLHLVVDRAVRTAQATRSPTCVIIPHDVQQLELPDQPEQAHAVITTSIGWERPRVLPSDDALDAAAAVLNAGERVALVVGQGAQDAA